MKHETLKMIAATAFTVSILTLYSVWNYFYEKDRLIAQIDKQLYSAAVSVPFVLESDFHDRAITIDSISQKEDNQNIKNLTRLNDQLGTKFLYTIIRDNNGVFRLSSSSALASEIANHEEVHYFTAYPDVNDILKNSFENLNLDFIKPNKIYKPLYVPVFSDKWGTYRSIFLPIRSIGGSLYVVGVDMDITYVNKILKQNTIQILLSFLLFLIAIAPMIFTYISTLKRKHKEYQEVHNLYIDQSKKSITDPLTKLYNRYKLDHELSIQDTNFHEKGTRFALLLLDIDHFKSINDKYGHQVGDELLQIFAKILKDSCRSTDTVGRWGGEEFMVIYPNSDLENSYQLAQKLHLVLKESKELQKYNLTVSIGIGVSKKDTPLEEFVKGVDKALYKAKELGRNQTVKVP